MSADPLPSVEYGLTNLSYAKLDRRSTPRFRTVCFDVKVVRGENAGLFRARNISDTGIKLDTHWQLTAGERVLVKLSESLAIHGAVLWSESGRCGIGFDRPIDCASLLRAGAELKRDDRRGALRLETMTRATSYGENGIRPVRITDVSPRGMGLAHDGTLAPGMQLKLIAENGVARIGAVRWATAGRAGVRLVEPLSSEELERVGETV
uniref:PilZ domain-containing protein n=1 Tax=Altererythrobacter segetis TaxID=1104773 RepID=UPI00140A2021|nr:PilZ domain-containing protein [Altererythrobacter segetis]